MGKFAERKNLLIVGALVIAALLIAMLLTTDFAYGSTTGTVTSPIGVNVRSGPGTDYGIIQKNGHDYALAYGTVVNIVATERDKSGNPWYKISLDGSYYYVSAEFIKVDQSAEYVTDPTFESYLTSQGFPESYKDYLRTLHAAHPLWVFKAQKTGLSWSDVIAKESVVGRNLVHKSYPDSWKSKEYGAFDSNTGKYVEFDSGGYVSASEAIIKYYMDPRNFLNEGGVFQFMAHSYDASTQNKDGLTKLIAGSFLANAFPEASSQYPTYADVLMDAGKTAGASPYVLASMIITEQGRNGTGNSISGKVSGYVGYYNFFNVNAYASGGLDAVTNGLKYASGSGSYDRPWNTRVKSIIGGAQFYAQSYIKNKQDTQYLKKFNVMNGLAGVATHQYMTNVTGAAMEASDLKTGYASISDRALTFYVPVYNNMPDTASPQPGSGNNDYFLSSLSVTGYNITPVFDMYTANYELIVPSDVTYVTVNAQARDAGAVVSGAGRVNLTSGVTKAVITVKASSGATKQYTITIAKEAGTSVRPQSSKYTVGQYITGVAFNTPVSTFKANISAPAGYTLKVLGTNGKELNSGNVGTGTMVVLYQNGAAVKSMYVVIKGDASGDGKVTSVDTLYAQRYIVKTYSLSGAAFGGADVNGDGRVTSVDTLYMQRHIVGTYTIKN